MRGKEKKRKKDDKEGKRYKKKIKTDLEENLVGHHTAHIPENI